MSRSLARKNIEFKPPEIDLSQSDFFALEKDETGFYQLAEILKQSAGISLANNPKNKSLMASRMIGFLKNHHLSGYSDLVKKIKLNDKKLKNDFIFALTTNTTQFFREPAHYEFLKSWLPGYFQKLSYSGSRELRVWCGAASTGQEPYSILMTLLDILGNPKSTFWDLKFLSTDIDLNVLNTCLEAKYSENEISGIPAGHLQNYFHKCLNGSQSSYRVKKEFQDFIRFAQMNLIEFPYPFQHQFDVIFCRNVLIYFEQDMASKVVETMLSHIKPGGILILGHSESGCMRSKTAKSVSHAVFEKK
jgi:chemotaxis protein methyltransferase CheR